MGDEDDDVDAEDCIECGSGCFDPIAGYCRTCGYAEEDASSDTPAA